MSAALKNVLKRAEASPFYRGKTITDFASAPITTKQDLRAQYPFGMLAVPKTKVVSYHESSGSEGKPISSYFSDADWKDITTRFLRSAVDLNREDTFFIKTPYSMVTTAHQAQRAARLASSLIVPGDNRTSNMPYPRVIQLLKDLDVTVSWSLPTEVLLWALTAERVGLDPQTDFPKLRAFWVAGEPLSAGKKAALQRLWGGKPIFEDYGSTETGSLAGECAQGNLHAWSDRVHFEVMNPATKEITPFGRGLLLVTPLFREAMPLIRYLIEDEVELKPSECACGSDLSMIHVRGRDSSRVAIQGRRILPRDIEDEVYRAGTEFGLSLFRAYHDETTLEIEFASRNSAACATAIREALEEKLSIEARATALPVEAFISPAVLGEKLQFAKPQFLFSKGEKDASHYYSVR